MLIELKVKDLGIIEDMTWSLQPGMNVITGETGAGKSLVVDAVELLLSGKADEDVIRYGASETRIEGIFALPQDERYRPLRELLAQKELVADEETLVIACQLRRKSPAVVRVNGHAVPRAFLQQIGRLLVDIHGQSEHLSLLDPKTHLDFLDAYARTFDLRNEFAAGVAELRRVEDELNGLAKDDKDRTRREEFLRFQVDEIEKAKLRDGEEEELEKELGLISSAEKLKEYSYDIYRALYEEDGGSRAASALDRLNEALQAMKKLVELDPSLSQQLKFLEETSYGVREVARDVNAYADRVSFDPDRLEEIETRLELIKNLKRKYGQSIAEILGYLAKSQAELDNVANYAERCSQLEEERARLKKELGKTACRLSQERSQAAGRLAAAVKRELNDLNMAQVGFEVSITQKPDPAGIPFPDAGSFAYASDGCDAVAFLVSTNPGEPAKPLAKIASTGELSRFTLALKSALSESDAIPVVVFDEIDIGVGGRSGEIIGKKLWGLSCRHQVICVTHLPQIAAFADGHYTVRKITSGERTLSVLESVTDAALVREIAMMLTGPQSTEASLNSARELIENARKWKEGQCKNG